MLMMPSSICSQQACNPQDHQCPQAILVYLYQCLRRPTGRSLQVTACCCLHAVYGVLSYHFWLNDLLTMDKHSKTCLFSLLFSQTALLLFKLTHNSILTSNFVPASACNTAEKEAMATPIKVAIPTEVNRKAFAESPGGLISPGDNSTVYEPDR